MKNVQDLSFKVNTKRNGKSYNEKRNSEQRLERKALVSFKLRKRAQVEDFAF